MKISKIALVSIIMLAIFTLGAVSAAEDANLTAGQEEFETTDETPLGEEEYITVEIGPADEIQYGKYNRLYVTVAEDVTGYVKYYVDEDEDYQEPDYISYDEPLNTGFDANEFGQHTLHVKYFNGNRPDKSFEFPFTVNDYYMSVFPMDEYEDLNYARDNWFVFSIPYAAQGTAVILVNGHEYKFKYNEDFGWGDTDFTIKKEHLIYGENTIKAIFTPYDKTGEFKAKTIEKKYNFTSRIEVPYSMEYNTERNITLSLPSDAEGTLTAIIGDKTYTKEIKNGKAAIAIPKLNVGYHTFSAKFEGNYNISSLENEYMYVVPNVIAPHYMWVKGEQKITIEMSDDIKGTIIASIDDAEIASAEIKNGTAVIELNLPASYYSISLYCTGDSYCPLNDVQIEILEDSPDWKMKISDNDILKTYAYLAIENSPEYISYEDGAFELTIDGKKVECQCIGGNVYFDASKMSSGPHDYTLAFNGDGYFLPTSESGTLNIADIVVIAPETYVYRLGVAENEYIDVYTPNDTTGTLTLKVNSKKAASKDVIPDDEYGHESFWLEDLDLKFNAVNKFEVIFKSAKYGTLTKSVDIYVTYVLMPQAEVRYGGSKLYIAAPTELDISKMSVKIEGVDYEVKKEGDDEVYVITPKDLPMGYHNATITYKGDGKYPANTNTDKFKVYASIVIEDNAVSLILPDDAKGNLTVTVNDNEYANLKANGKVVVDLNQLPWGRYFVETEYTGDDYEVYEESKSVFVNPEFKVPQKMIAGDDESVSIDVPGAEGHLEIYGHNIELVSKDLVDGKASISLAGLTAGKHTLTVGFSHEYYNEDGEYWDADYYSEDFEIEVINPIPAKDASVLYSASATYTAQIKDVNGNAVTSGSVTFFVLDGKKQILKKTVSIKNGAAKLTYKINSAPKVYKIKTVYNKATVTKKLTVKSIVTLKAVTVKKSAKKLTLQATLKKVNGKYLKKKTVTFKFNGKTYKAKTNSKGIAKATIKSSVLKKLKVGKKITYQATYLKDTVKKTVKVKK
ncbi:hypothetical protein [Methanobrevibacter sp.]|uniref:hypothetical protein n=1 Tax=Methanobrevibacter sp. TaxID=66852 RepID=UPI00388D588D